ncbi:uncharacterized protein SOCE26_066790 [Sorangium cellulosum]|uniref:Secreted protein n=1 Tax=Sorangium cellulosum TaxID=56 RepID=A0A2L0F0U5_SORCE|nr:hypothetical protein [Sorangium cellulosum]AUX45198.1 uncharacterized protein SOCE26_066790 [Sorangium cellulosum]
MPRTLRLLPALALVSALLAPRAVLAQVPCFPWMCPPPAPAAPARPPPLTPELELATRARLEAEARPRLEPQARATAAQQVQDERRRAWIERGIEREPNPVRLRLPLLEVFAAGRWLGTLAGLKYSQQAVGLGARLRPGEPLAFEIAAAYASIDIEEGERRVSAVMIEPSVVFIWGRRQRVDVYLRSGLEVTLPFADDARPPAVMLGGHVGLGTQFRVARIGRGGFVGWFAEARGFMRGGLGGDVPGLKGPHAGLEFLFGPSAGF